MAAALRLIAAGAFGERVADLLDRPGATRGDEPGGDVTVAALWRPAPARLAAVDDAAARLGVPWLPVVAEHPRIVVGPYVAPGGPCHGCYAARRAQHAAPGSVTAELHAAYDADPALGPAGFLPAHARGAAGLAAAALRAADPGRVTVWHPGTGAVATHHVAGVHGCARCDRTGAPATVAAALAGFLPAAVR
ncbi:TOMM precursor leader peptide-binding protein [Spirilliplanes yamanashiensis]|uniref:Bacteriocin biosynthesis cyclodehydratase domain-containing protein n=1 Tax=Spirilliplanes yamanashiensis TaxID=42233 RepID=A0A8J4DGI6_9ACTN|nr:TOMM precursor leader peptide-binding protein [Spirilliplanes yamanashiensis]MDP9820000.1 bacteriocin biosynthesis cyclodehydratase domain-containing protein [Spirilliplanes yamanashiensis]GIJ01181.1 hypothetical protein Sya03_05330 [Spirilliplanes yamanashiensis]